MESIINRVINAQVPSDVTDADYAAAFDAYERSRDLRDRQIELLAVTVDVIKHKTWPAMQIYNTEFDHGLN